MSDGCPKSGLLSEIPIPLRLPRVQADVLLSSETVND
jgi:hypothetical protein